MKMTPLRLLGALLLGASGLPHAYAVQWQVDQWFSDDTDGTTQYQTFAGATVPLGQNGDSSAGAGAGYRHISEVSGNTHFRYARGDLEHAFNERTRVFASATGLDGSDWSTVLGDARVAHTFSAPVYLELSASREIVDTLIAIVHRWDVVSTGASLDIGPFSGFTMVGAYTRQALGDDNNRDIWVARLIYELGPRQHWMVQTRSRLLRSDFDAVGYFSPRRLDEHLLLLTYRRPVLDERWYLSIEGGSGVQVANRGSSREIYQVNLVWRGWFNDHVGLESSGGCMNTGGFNARAASGGYRYCQGIVSLLWSW